MFVIGIWEKDEWQGKKIKDKTFFSVILCNIYNIVDDTAEQINLLEFDGYKLKNLYMESR